MTDRRGFFGLLLGAVGAGVIAKRLVPSKLGPYNLTTNVIPYDEPYVSHVWSGESQVDEYIRHQLTAAKDLGLDGHLWGVNVTPAWRVR